ncbi:transcription negative regulator ChrR [Acidiferrobacter sp. SPIII_3]|jgi:anti-sigma factor ChrR (cupin superfamily)|uniref:cupin domain-containing protein n=1 Tax=Acidiferrobacter sp. SPIII_3 TaxID=1281578 RepID=UPI000D728028|nr:cupin domain-containing protein [Acidiferrobacter sp. SPIII_3]AWP24188.1 transcription negative regulator ChrR [Acidiferrobacter sp. SPIII_3]
MKPEENAPTRPHAEESDPDDGRERLARAVSRYVLTPSDLAQHSPQWRVLRTGVRIRELFTGTCPRIALLSYAPGARVPLHLHTGDEHIFVIQGSQSDEHGDYEAGSYVFNPAGSRHSVHSREGCVVLIQWQAPVAFVDNDQNE